MATKAANGDNATAELLAVRKARKTHKPAFRNQDSHQRKRIAKAWRTPRGNQSKVRLRHFGKPARPSPGYGTALAVRGLGPDGLPIFIVHALNDLETVPAQHNVLIASTVGGRVREAIIAAAQAKKIPIRNYRDAAGWLAKRKADREAKKADKDKEKAAKTKAKAEKPKPAKEKKEKPEEAAATPEEKKEEEREQMEKVITQRS